MSKQSKLGSGTLTPRLVSEDSLHGLFLTAIHKVAPEVVNALQTDVFPVGNSRWETPCPLELHEIDALREFSDAVSRRLRGDVLDVESVTGYMTAVSRRLRGSGPPMMIRRLERAARRCVVKHKRAQGPAAYELEKHFARGSVAAELAVALFQESPRANAESESLAQQKVAVCSWAQNYNILVDWVVDAAWYKLSRWFNGNDEPGDLHLQVVGNAFMDLHPELDRSVTLGEWDPSWEDRQAAEKRFKTLLHECLDTIEDEFRKATDWPTTPRKDQRHLEWVAQWRCLGWNAPRIFKKYYQGEEPARYLRKARAGRKTQDRGEIQYNTIHKAIRETEAALGFTHLPMRGGRPPRIPRI